MSTTATAVISLTVNGLPVEVDEGTVILDAAAAAGISVARVKLLAFAVSSFIAGVAGTLIGYRFGAVSDASFGEIPVLLRM